MTDLLHQGEKCTITAQCSLPLHCCQGVNKSSFLRCNPAVLCIHVTDHDRTDHEGVSVGEIFVYIIAGWAAMTMMYVCY